MIYSFINVDDKRYGELVNAILGHGDVSHQESKWS